MNKMNIQELEKEKQEDEVSACKHCESDELKPIFDAQGVWEYNQCLECGEIQ